MLFTLLRMRFCALESNSATLVNLRRFSTLFLLNHVPVLKEVRSHVPSTVPHYAKLFQTKTNDIYRQYYMISLSVYSSILFRLSCKFGSEMVQISAISCLCHCHQAFFYLCATATCATFFSSRQCRSGTKNGASAQHW